jgi:hypothetical protein
METPFTHSLFLRVPRASTFFNYNVPSGVSKPAWWFNKLYIVDASTATFYSTNGHRFGYAGFQVSETNPYQGRVLFSIWDQGGCDKERNRNCPANQVAKTVACGTGILVVKVLVERGTCLLAISNAPLLKALTCCFFPVLLLQYCVLR